MFAIFATLVLISFKAFALAQLPGAGVGFVIGAFCPAVLRKIKSAFVAEGSKIKSAVVADVQKAASDVAKKV